MSEFVPNPAREAALKKQLAVYDPDQPFVCHGRDLAYLLAALDAKDAALRAAQAERDRLLMALRYYGFHLDDCAEGRALGRVCDCGLDAALAGPPPAGEGG